MRRGFIIAAMLLTAISATFAQATTPKCADTKCADTKKPLNVASYNIRYQNDDDRKNGNGWEHRSPFMFNLIRFNNFDIFGSQEVLNSQLNDILAALPEYGHVGVGRDDGKTKGEYAPIFYKKSRLELLKSGTFWLSPITDRPNVGWDAALPRICTWGEFSDLATGTTLWFFNLHMDHIGTKARAESAKLVLAKIGQMCSEAQAVILTGDFNVDQHDQTFTLLANSSTLFDTYTTAKICYAPNGTFNAFDPNRLSDERIDHIFVSKHFKVDRYGILTDTYRSLPGAESGKVDKTAKPTLRIVSDHYPVNVELTYDYPPK